MVTELSTFDVAMLSSSENPYPYYRAVRTHSPIVETPIGWVVLGYQESDTLLRSRDTLVGHIAEAFRQTLPEGAARDEMTHRINFLDAPDHTRVRKLVVQAFTPKRVEALLPFIQRLCQSKVNEMPSAGPIDILPGFAHDVPTLVISELLGIPGEDREYLGRLASEVAVLLSLGLAPMSEELIQSALASAEEMHAYLRCLIDARRETPTDDLLSDLIAAETEGSRLNDRELLSLVATLYSAGHRSTHDFFANALTDILNHPQCREEFQAGLLPVTHVVEEALRFTTPTFYVSRRTAKPIELGRVTIPEGATTLLVLGAANHDPRVYDAPDQFLPQRWSAQPAPPPVLSFAFGPHFCLGAHLARLEVQTMITTLFDAYPKLEFARLPSWQQNGIYRSVDTLVLNLGVRSSDSPTRE